MQDLYKSLITNQYEAAFCTLHECVTRCPDEMWQAPVVNHPFSQSIFHTLFFADLYLGTDMDAQRQQPFHRQHAEAFADYEQLEDRIPHGRYEKSFIVEYLQHCRAKARQVVAAETARQLTEPAGFAWLNTTRAEVHVYNIRHIQHHAAQLILRLRGEAGQDMPWVKSGWQEF